MAKPLIESLEVMVGRARAMDAPINERLAVIANGVRALNPGYADAVERLIGRLKENGAGATAPKPGDEMPDFILPDEAGKLVRLETLLKKGPVAIAFNRGHWCPYCRVNTVALTKAHREATEHGGQIVAILPDRQKFTTTLKAETQAPFPLLTDMDNGYALGLDLVVWVGAEMQQLLPRAGADVPTYQGNESWLIPIPATFVVGTDGRIVARHVDPDYRKRIEVEDLLAALKRAL